MTFWEKYIRPLGLLNSFHNVYDFITYPYAVHKIITYYPFSRKTNSKGDYVYYINKNTNILNAIYVIFFLLIIFTAETYIKYRSYKDQSTINFLLYVFIHVQMVFAAIVSTIHMTRRMSYIMESLKIISDIDYELSSLHIKISYKGCRNIVYSVSFITIIAVFGVVVVAAIVVDDFTAFLVEYFGYGYPCSVLIIPMYLYLCITYLLNERFVYLEKYLQILSKCKSVEVVKMGLRRISVMYGQICTAYENIINAQGVHLLCLITVGFGQVVVIIFCKILFIGDVNTINVIWSGATLVAIFVVIYISESITLQSKVIALDLCEFDWAFFDEDVGKLMLHQNIKSVLCGFYKLNSASVLTHVKTMSSLLMFLLQIRQSNSN